MWHIWFTEFFRKYVRMFVCMFIFLPFHIHESKLYMLKEAKMKACIKLIAGLRWVISAGLKYGWSKYVRKNIVK